MVPLFLWKCDQIIVDVMILVCPARVLARQVRRRGVFDSGETEASRGCTQNYNPLVKNGSK